MKNVACSFIYFLIISFVILEGCDNEIREENTELKEKVAQLQAENDSLKSVIVKLQTPKKTEKAEGSGLSFDAIVRYVKPRIRAGASEAVALGKYQNASVKWRVRVDEPCPGLRGMPVLFTKGCAHIYGYPSYGLSQIKFISFCQTNFGKLITLEGRLKSVTDIVLGGGDEIDLSFTMEVSSVSLK